MLKHIIGALAVLINTVGIAQNCRPMVYENSPYDLYLTGGYINEPRFWFRFTYAAESELPMMSKPFVFESQSLPPTGNYDCNVFLLPDGRLQISDVNGTVIGTTANALYPTGVFNVWGHKETGFTEISFDLLGNPRPNGGSNWAGGVINDTNYVGVLGFWYPTGHSGQWISDVEWAGEDVFAGGASPTPTPTPNPTPIATATVTPTATAAATPTATVSQCVVPNFVGQKVRDAQGIWMNAGFTTQVTVEGNIANGNKRIRSQSIPAGTQGDCHSTVITLRL